MNCLAIYLFLGIVCSTNIYVIRAGQEGGGGLYRTLYYPEADDEPFQKADYKVPAYEENYVNYQYDPDALIQPEPEKSSQQYDEHEEVPEYDLDDVVEYHNYYNDNNNPSVPNGAFDNINAVQSRFQEEEIFLPVEPFNNFDGGFDLNMNEYGDVNHRKYESDETFNYNPYDFVLDYPKQMDNYAPIGHPVHKPHIGTNYYPKHEWEDQERYDDFLISQHDEPQYHHNEHHISRYYIDKEKAPSTKTKANIIPSDARIPTKNGPFGRTDQTDSISNEVIDYVIEPFDIPTKQVGPYYSPDTTDPFDVVGDDDNDTEDAIIGGSIKQKLHHRSKGNSNKVIMPQEIIFYPLPGPSKPNLNRVNGFGPPLFRQLQNPNSITNVQPNMMVTVRGKRSTPNDKPALLIDFIIEINVVKSIRYLRERKYISRKLISRKLAYEAFNNAIVHDDVYKILTLQQADNHGILDTFNNSRSLDNYITEKDGVKFQVIDLFIEHFVRVALRHLCEKHLIISQAKLPVEELVKIFMEHFRNNEFYSKLTSAESGDGNQEKLKDIMENSNWWLCEGVEIQEGDTKRWEWKLP